MQAFSFSETDSWLRRRNPSMKLAAHLATTLIVTLVFDPFTPLAFTAVAFVAGRLLGRIPVLRLASALTGFWLLGISLVISNALFAHDPAGATMLFAWGPLRGTIEGAMIGLALAERMAAIAAFSIIFTMSTDPTDLVRSLVQQLRMPPRFAYPLLAAYRFLPGLQGEYETIRLAQRLRTGRPARGPIAWFRQQRRVIVPLFAGAIRRTDRVAVAMDSRAFESGARRTCYRRIRVGWPDVALLVATISIGVAILAGSATVGVLRIWTGSLGT